MSLNDEREHGALQTNKKLQAYKLSSASKVVEKILLARIKEVTVQKELLSPEQFHFQNKYSAEE